MTTDELAERLDKALDQALTLCTSAKEYADILKIGVEYYSKRRETTDGAYGKALTRGSANGGG